MRKCFSIFGAVLIITTSWVCVIEWLICWCLNNLGLAICHHVHKKLNLSFDLLQLLDIRVGVLSGSAVEGVVKIINPRLYQMCQDDLVESTDKAIQSLM